MAGDQGITWIAMGILFLYVVLLTLFLLDLRSKAEESLELSEEALKTIHSLESSVSSLEEKSGKIEVLEKELSESSRSLRGEIFQLRGKILSLESSLKRTSEGIEKVSSFEEDIESLRKKISGLEKALEGIFAKLGKISSVESDLERLEKKLESLHGLERDLSKLKGDLQRLSENFEKRFESFESELSIFEDKLAIGVKERISLKERLSLLENRVSLHEKIFRKVFENVDPLLSTSVNLVLRKGDTLYEISKAYGVSVQELLRVNGIVDPRRIKAGERLTVPVSLISKIRLPFGNFDYGKVISFRNGWVKVKGEIVRAMMPGRVEVNGDKVTIHHGNDVLTKYRLVNTDLKSGDWVKEGDLIGKSARYYEFSLQVKGEMRDPFRYIGENMGEFTATFYTEWEDGILPEQASFRVTRSGDVVRKWWTVAADPSVLPLGSVIYVPQLSDKPGGGIFEVQDVGGSVKGKRIDVYVENISEAAELWKMEVEVYVLRKGQ